MTSGCMQRAVAMPDGSIQVRPVMYLALSCDHRIIGGGEAATFLVWVKECIESPKERCWMRRGNDWLDCGFVRRTASQWSKARYRLTVSLVSS